MGIFMKGQLSFLVTPNGSLQSFNLRTGKTKVLGNNMPSDNREPGRMKSVSSYIELHPASTMSAILKT